MDYSDANMKSGLEMWAMLKTTAHFTCFSHLTYVADHELTAGSVLDDFVPLEYTKASIGTKEKFCRTGPLYSSSVCNHHI